MNDDILVNEFEYSLKNKNYERAYNVLKVMVKTDIISCKFTNKTAMIVLYFEFLTKHNCYNELKAIYNKLHNKCVYYRHNKCYGQKGMPKVNCKGNRRNCEQ